MSNGKGSSPRNNHSKAWQRNFDSMTLSVEEARVRCAGDDGYVWYAKAEDFGAHIGKQWRATLGFFLDDGGTCGFWGHTYFKTGIRNSRVRKQMTFEGKTVLLLDKDSEVVE